jgi:aldehyde:ferredoxin oxidoreductase
MPLLFFGNYPLVEFFNAVTGLDVDISEVLETGARIQTLRQCFNVREGIRASDIQLPGRLLGNPPLTEGPLSDVTIDVDNLRQEYFQSMGWEPDSGQPQPKMLEKLGLSRLVNDFG